MKMLQFEDRKQLFIQSVIVFIFTMEAISIGDALKCWKCIAHDCVSDPEDNYKASKIDCSDGNQCMKVRYRMFDNVTHYDSVIRTCTDQPCQQNSTGDFEKCVSTPKQYMIGGCTLRSCCDDRDFCNVSAGLFSHVTWILCWIFTWTLAFILR